jgi:hypothetical protein
VSKKKGFQENLLLDQVVFEAKVEEIQPNMRKKKAQNGRKYHSYFPKAGGGYPLTPPLAPPLTRSIH